MSDWSDKAYERDVVNVLAVKAVTGARWSLLGQWSRFGCQILSVVILARILTPQDYGLFAVVAALAGFATVVGDFGLSAASIQAKEISATQRSNLFWINSGIGLVAAGTLILLGGPIAAFYGQPDAEYVTYAMSANFVILAMTTQFVANVTRDMRYRLIFVADLLAPVLGLLVALVLALLGFGVWALVIQQLVSSGVILTVYSVGGKWHPRWPSRAPMGRLLSFGAKAFAVQVLNYASASIGSILLGRFHGVYAAGIFDRAKQINSIPGTQLATPLTRVMLPALSRVQDDLETVTRQLARAENVLAYAIGGIMMFILVLSDWLVIVALGERWIEVAPVLSVLSIGGFFTGMGYVLQWAFMITNRVGLQLTYSVFTRIVMIAMVLAAVPFGVMGIATAVSAGLIVNWLVLYLVALPRTGIPRRPLWLPAARPLAVHFVVGLLSYVSKNYLINTDLSMMSVWLTTGVVMVGGYAIAYIISKPVRQDLAGFKALLQRRTTR